MFTNYRNNLRGRLLSKRRQWTALVGLFLFLACVSSHGLAQGTFNSGSTGADGAFSPSPGATPVQIPPSGVFNFTTINIPVGVTVTFLRNAKNTPVTMLAQGNVTIAGTINVDGRSPNSVRGGGIGAVGGFNGGGGGFGVSGLTTAITGDGPGGGSGGSFPASGGVGGGGGAGHAVVGGGGGGSGSGPGTGGPVYGTGTLVPPTGGSGGGGGGGHGNNQWVGTGGGGGGGAILIASSGTITFNSGVIVARGATGGNRIDLNVCGTGGGGSGGAIRLVANTISGAASLDVTGALGGGGSSCGAPGGAGGFGFIRIQAFDLGNFTPSVNPNDTRAITVLRPPSVLETVPQLRIGSVAGVVPIDPPVGSLAGPPDIVIPTPQTGPVDVVIQATNIPVGTVVQVTLTPDIGTRTTVSATLAGTQASSTATASLTLPTSGQSVISAGATIDLTLSKANPLFINGDRIDRIEVAATFGAASEVTYITRSGKRIRKSD
jgi:hypothetical protein